MVSTQHHGLETLSPEKFRDLHNAFRKMILNGSVPNQPKAKAMPDLAFKQIYGSFVYEDHHLTLGWPEN
ncbi:hypothetical protein X801_03533 [Opisthorchis viverrini]|uniref:Uncharacterized protein n=1 Tax=Opisthorchis viverrini TaxID=6198 RepID=A0A1S8X1J7_OPIVI|nr:hypothetical protein X801_03533 [Opisthorchis viverrini]